MQVAILCGGLGSRLKTITEKTPKALVPIKGKPFLETLLELFCRQGFKRFLFLTGYLGDQIEKYFSDGKKWGCMIQYSREMSPMGTGGALKNAENLLEPEFLLMNGDTYLDIDYRDLVSDFKKNNPICELVIYQDINKEMNITPNIIWDKDERTILLYEKDTGRLCTHIDSGMIAVSKRAFQFFPDGPFSFEKQIFPLLIEKKALRGYETSKRFYDIGTLERILDFDKSFQR